LFPAFAAGEGFDFLAAFRTATFSHQFVKIGENQEIGKYW
jgi:hypothetical protein